MIYDDYFDEYLSLHPLTATRLGDNRWNDRFLNIYSEFYQKQRLNLYQKYLDIVTLDSKNLENKYFRIFLESKLDIRNKTSKFIPITHSNNIFISFLEVSLKYQPSDNIANYLRRCKEFKESIPSLISRLRQGMSMGIVLPKCLTIILIQQLEDIIINFTDYLRKMPINFPPLLVKYFLPALRKFLIFLKSSYLKSSRDSIGYLDLPSGSSLYQYYVDRLCCKLSIPDIHEWGLNEIDRILNQMKYKKDIKIANSKILSTYREINNIIEGTTIEKYFDRNMLVRKCNIKKIPNYLEKYLGLAYYEVPRLDGSGGEVYLSNSVNKKSEILSLSLHENIPGHHYQYSIAIQNNVPKYRIWNSWISFIEGWATYVENLGFYDDLSLYGKYQLELLRAIRLVVDTGIHYYGWDFEKSFKFIKQISPEMEKKEIEQEIYRYLAKPGSVLAYKLGEKAFLDGRKRWIIRHGRSSLGKFHKKILINGPIPISLLYR